MVDEKLRLKGAPDTAMMRKIQSRLIAITATPRQIAMGFALGVFVGVTPYWGFHTIAAVLLALLFRGSAVSAALGVHVGNPITAPFIFGLTYWVGEKLIPSAPICFVWNDFSAKAALNLLKEAPNLLEVLSAGAAVVGLPLAVASYWLVYRAVRDFRVNVEGGSEKSVPAGREDAQ